MEQSNIEQRLAKIEEILASQNLQTKSIFNIRELVEYTGLKKFYIYKLTSKKEIPYSKPNGKNIFFKKDEIDKWLLRNRKSTHEEISNEAINFSVNRKW